MNDEKKQAPEDEEESEEWEQDFVYGDEEQDETEETDDKS